MKSKVLNEAGERTIALIFDSGEEVMENLVRFVRDQNVNAARFTAIGAFSEATLGYFDMERKDYLRIAVNEQVEVLSLIGDVALEKENPKIHAHVVVGKRDGTAHGGHLLSARVRPTLEVILVQSPSFLKRTYRPEVGLALIDITA